MPLFRRAVEALAQSIAHERTLPTLLAGLERALCAAVHPARIAIVRDTVMPSPGVRLVPVGFDGVHLATLVVRSDELAESVEIADVLATLAPLIGVAIAHRLQPAARDEDSEHATHDALCAIPNRRGFDEHIRTVWDRAARGGSMVVMALVDVDYFKTYNDRYGHTAGDRCLALVASLLVRRRQGDDGFAARYGGEEFILVFEQTTVDDAVLELTAIADRLAAVNIEHAGTTLGRVSISVGIAAVTPTPASGPLALIEEADRALYQAKRLGRNRIVAGTYVSKGDAVAKLRSRQAAFASTATPSFGRANDLALVLSALRHTRVLTLVGPHGIGKSRLLRLAADDAANRLRRPVVFVEGELLRAGMDPATAVAATCDLALDSGGLIETVIDHLADREAIVMFDDVVDARAGVAALCRHLCAQTVGVSIISASSAGLGVDGERTFVVPPLDDDAALELLTFRAGGALRHAREVVPYLGGNPATIEAAAAAIARLGVSAVWNRLVARGAVCSDPLEFAKLLSPAVPR